MLSVFIFIFQCGALDSAQIREKEASSSSSQVVVAQARTHPFVGFSASPFVGHFGQTSLAGSHSPSPHFLRNECRLGWPVEVLIVYENKWEESCLLRSVWRFVAQWNSSQVTATARRGTGLDVQSLVRLAESSTAKLGKVFLFFQKFIQKASAQTQNGTSTTTAERQQCSAEPRKRQGAQRARAWRWAALCTTSTTPSSPATVADPRSGHITGISCEYSVSCRFNNNSCNSAASSRQQGICKASSRCLSRCPNEASRGHSSYRTCRTRNDQKCYEIIAQCHEGIGQSTEVASGSSRGPTGPSKQLACPSLRKYQDMGDTVGVISTTWSCLARACPKSSCRHCSGQKRHSTAQHSRAWQPSDCGSFCGHCRRRTDGGSNRCRRREVAYAASRDFADMCWIIRGYNSCTCRCPDNCLGRRSRWRAYSSQTSQICRTWCWSHNDVTVGSAITCLRSEWVA